MEVRWKEKKYKVHKFWLFIILFTIIKIIFMGVFSSDYQNKMFMPFIDTFLDNLGEEVLNPYKYYYINGIEANFPYPTFMLIIESAGGIILHCFNELPLFFSNIIFKLPLLCFDFIGLYYMVKLFPNKRRYVGVFYFASPIIFYSIYMHGQLDIIPTALIIACIYYQTAKIKNNYLFSAFFLSAAILTKFHIVAVIPAIFIYLYKKEGIKEVLKLFFRVMFICAIFILPVWGNGFIENVVFNSGQEALTKVFFEFAQIQIYLPVLAVILIYLSMLNLNRINKELFISYCGIIFAVFLALVPPMPGWYVWIVPFITLFFININQNKYKNIIIYMILNGLYIVYFVFFHITNYVDLYFLNVDLSLLKISNAVMKNMVFTLLIGVLVYIIFLMYRLGVTSNSLYKRRNLPIAIGVAGDSGSGKSTFINIVENSLGSNNLLFIEGDGDHKWERGEKMWEEYTHLNPKANYLYRQAMDIKMLRTGTSICRVEYNHTTGKFTESYKIKPKKYIVLCGLHSFYLPQMRKCLDLKVYMDVEETLRRYWKIERDIAYRGYEKDEIMNQIEDRAEDANRYIVPQKEYADLIIQYFDKTLLDCCEKNHQVELSLKLTFSAAINVEPLISKLECFGIEIEYDFNEDLTKQTLIFDGVSLHLVKLPFETIAQKIIPQLDEITKQDLDYSDNISGIIMLVLFILISYRMQGDIL